jgi:hypothetical protein
MIAAESERRGIVAARHGYDIDSISLASTN